MNRDTMKLAPTRKAIDEWRGNRTRGVNFWDRTRGVDVRTHAGSWRCISGVALDLTTDEPVGYWTIRAEGSSNEGKETWVEFDRIAEARGWTIGPIRR